MWMRTDLLELLGIEHPIIQAPMSGITTPELAAAVSNAGALGSLGCGILPAAAIREQLTATQHATNRPINVNFFAHPAPARDDAAAQSMRDRLRGCYEEVGLGPVPEPGEPFPPSIVSVSKLCSSFARRWSASTSAYPTPQLCSS
ncbi:nitronate monooxygenase [Mesorhizobium sp. M0199]|uniref:NAD(P)H-dependent flavin oxidoreductase n=1 Tax=unclassified Mesorhizobium TaxID=325217 RepID=UPI0033366189